MNVHMKDINLSVFCPFVKKICPIMEDLPLEERTLLVCDSVCNFDVKEVFAE